MSIDAIRAQDNNVPGAPHSAVWGPYLSVFAIALMVLGAACFADIRAAVIVWWVYPAYSHCFLIIPIFIWLLWERRAELSALTPRAQPILLLGALPFFD